ncbi:MAG: hypothetical protein FJX95_09185 [Bacteroidetes bacterium]|nr:hypothetical protein [Bacteroidota bacterium]
MYVIHPAIHNWHLDPKRQNGGKKVRENFSYSSDKNELWMSKEQLLTMLKQYEHRGQELVRIDDAKEQTELYPSEIK